MFPRCTDRAGNETALCGVAMLEELGQNYIRTARAKGLSENAVLWRHALPNALAPIVKVVGLQFGALLAGAILTETIFSWPGLGRLTVSAISNRDYALVQGCLLSIGLTYVLVNFLRMWCIPGSTPACAGKRRASNFRVGDQPIGTHSKRWGTWQGAGSSGKGMDNELECHHHEPSSFAFRVRAHSGACLGLSVFTTPLALAGWENLLEPN